jgi:hypothetical protein
MLLDKGFNDELIIGVDVPNVLGEDYVRLRNFNA